MTWCYGCDIMGHRLIIPPLPLMRFPVPPPSCISSPISTPLLPTSPIHTLPSPPPPRAEAVIKAFGVLTDPENLSTVLDALGPFHGSAVKDRLGPVGHYNPANPTGVYNLILSQVSEGKTQLRKPYPVCLHNFSLSCPSPLQQPSHRTVAKRLLLAFIQQWDLGLCTFPYHMAFTTCTVDGKV